MKGISKYIGVAGVLMASLVSVELFAQDLQKMIDKASESAGKHLKLEAKTYFIDKTIKLTPKHNGLVIEGASIPDASDIASWYRGGGDNIKMSKISSGRRIEGWTREGSVWKAKLDGVKFISSLYVNGVRAKPAEFPKNGYLRFLPRDVKTMDLSCLLIRNEDMAVLKGLSDGEIKNILINITNKWVNQRTFIEKIVPRADGKTSAIYFPGKIDPQLAGRGWDPRFKFLNLRSALSEPGEYFFDVSNGTIYYIPRSGEDMATADVYYPTLNTLIKGEGTGPKDRLENITIKNVAIEYASSTPTLNGGRAWDNVKGQTQKGLFAAVDFIHACNIRLDGLFIKNIDGYGVDLGDSVWDSSIENSILGDLGGGGIRAGKNKSNNFNPQTLREDGVSSGYIKVSNNIVFQYGRINRSAVGIIFFDIGHSQILNNDIFDGYYSGVSVGWTWGAGKTHTFYNKINYNRIHDIAYGQMCDLGGIYTLGISDNSEIVGNYIYNVSCHEYGGWGIYQDEGSANYKVHGNFVRNAVEGGYNMHYGKNCDVYNNVFCYGKKFQLNLSRQEDNSFIFHNNVVCYESPATLFRNNREMMPSAVKFDSNIYWNDKGEVLFSGGKTFGQWKKETGQDLHSYLEKVDVDALFAGAAIDKIDFKPLEMDRVGVYGVQKLRLELIMKGYRYPEVVQYPKYSPWHDDRNLEDFFEEQDSSGKPLLMGLYGANEKTVELIKDGAIPRGRVLRVHDTDKSSNLPRAWHAFRFKNSGEIGISFKMRVNSGSCFTYEVRNPNIASRNDIAPYGVGPGFSVENLKLSAGGKSAELPPDKWLDVEFVIPLPMGKYKQAYTLRVSESGKDIFSETMHCASKDFVNPSWAGFSMCGKTGSHCDFAEFRIRRLK